VCNESLANPVRSVAARDSLLTLPLGDNTTRLSPVEESGHADVYRYTLGNGLKVLLVEDREGPLIELSTKVRSGTAWDPPHILQRPALSDQHLTVAKDYCRELIARKSDRTPDMAFRELAESYTGAKAHSFKRLHAKASIELRLTMRDSIVVASTALGTW